MYYDRAGRPIDQEAWSRLLDDSAYRVLEHTELAGGVLVSTIWLGLIHGGTFKEPMIFETQVFGGELDGAQQGYRTELEALEGHAAMVGRVGGVAR